MFDGPPPEIIFDPGNEREYKPGKISYRTLIEMLKMGAEPVNKGSGWTVTELDRLGLPKVLLIEDGVVRQVKAFGIAEITRETSGLVMRIRSMRDNHSL